MRKCELLQFFVLVKRILRYRYLSFTIKYRTDKCVICHSTVVITNLDFRQVQNDSNNESKSEIDNNEAFEKT